ncbi:pyridoxamine 5'-phosphate oxidase family protein [Foetidibacter luteolus]|uniref:pyridoxamine 5'-phosphate oxidase family protein n=1 Tax=Foetidibacter luteolus TaxID=2608880 RepID=UPI00129A3649|nr:pyridoxamine 5'-phosphate oxidase family protein [Foetidibacter luteolus]
MIGMLEDAQIEDVLRKQLVGRIGCHADNLTYVVPISYAYENGFIYAHTYEGQKLDMMRKNPSVCFEADTMENMAAWKSVICQGYFEEVTDEAERIKGIRLLLDRELPFISSETVHLTPQWPFSSDEFDMVKGVIFRIKLLEKTGRYEIQAATKYYAS